MTAPTPDPTAGERPHNCDGWDSCPNPAHRAVGDASDPTAGEGLSRVIRSATDLWDEPLDEVHDVPPIVNAILASDWLAARESAAATRARAEALREYRDALANNESAENWLDRADYLHDIDDWIAFTAGESA